MDSRLKFRPRLVFVEASGDRGTKGQRPCGLAVQPRRGNPRRDTKHQGQPGCEWSGVDTLEKPGGENTKRPYRKPTQVGKASSLR